ncbi:MAG: hypothetical protein JNJ78_00390 [Anaerolineae bacterium]|nr:hypothetical protein [Anaerolineae bacterium]
MFPEDRVLVGVINRKRDLDHALQNWWYRIPEGRMKHGVNTEYIAFFLSRAFKERNGGIYYFAECQGFELVKRRDLIPEEHNHPRADEVYYKLQFRNVKEKSPPVINTTKRSVSFIYTTWDRFVKATTIRDLYSKEDIFVDRIYHALHHAGIQPDRTWSAEFRNRAAELRILCQNGTFVASTRPDNPANMYLNVLRSEDEILAEILAGINHQGGPLIVPIPIDRI